MNKIISIIIFLAVWNIGNSQCTADFSGSPLFGCGPLTTNFTDASTNAVTWNWNFGDGNTSNLQNPSHTYSTPGIHTVALTITSGGGCSDTRTRSSYVQVIGPNVNFGADTLQACSALNVSFTDSTIFGAPITFWTWNFGDGGSSNLQNPSHLYTIAGAHNVSLTVTDIDGCSRIVTKAQYININYPTTGTDTRTECDSLIWIDGNTYYSNNNTATFNIVGGAANLCDSLVTLDLTINNSTTGTDTRTECDSLIWIDGNTYYSNNNTATFNIVGGAANLCDSLVILDLTINTVNSSVTQAGELLTADEAGANYQWLQCPNMTPINLATSQSYTTTTNGDYAVIVTKNGCTDTSLCYGVIGVGIIENNFENELLIYPNPTDGNFSIDLGDNYETTVITITDLNGRTIQSKKYTDSQLLNLKLKESAGVYLLLIESEKKKAVIRLLKE